MASLKQSKPRSNKAAAADRSKSISFKMILIFLIGSILPSFIWTLSLTLFPATDLPKSLQDSSVYLITAHPDDEAMFFGPVLHRLKQFNNSVSVICFSTGDNEGIGHIRKTELENAVTYFGSQEDHVNLLTIVDKPEIFPDSMTVDWSSEDLAKLVNEIIQKDTTKKEISILTFDQFGVSNHPNHRSLYNAAMLLTRDRESVTGNEELEPKQYSFWSLNTISVFRKYTSVLDSFVIYLLDKFSINDFSSSVSTVDSATVVSSFEEYSKTLSAMTKAHKSQMKWFRYGWIIFSRYMVVNDIHQIM